MENDKLLQNTTVSGERKCLTCLAPLGESAHFNRDRCKECARKRNNKRNTEATKRWKQTPEGKVAARLIRRRSDEKVKRETLQKYGKQGKTKCRWRGCEIDDVDMLSIDHVADNGKSERAQKQVGSGISFYRRLRTAKWPPGYQTLCANHQLKKEIARRRRRK